jgi:hypothetical protein
MAQEVGRTKEEGEKLPYLGKENFKVTVLAHN